MVLLPENKFAHSGQMKSIDPNNYEQIVVI